jgi:hypothetical protein
MCLLIYISAYIFKPSWHISFDFRIRATGASNSVTAFETLHIGYAGGTRQINKPLTAKLTAINAIVLKAQKKIP